MKPHTIAFAFLMMAASGARAGEAFTLSDSELFLGWLDLVANGEELYPGQPQREFGAYAIAESGTNMPVIYVMFSSFKGRLTVHNAFRCDKEFTVLETHTNGFYDVRCAKQYTNSDDIVSVLRYEGERGYVEHFIE